MLTQLGKFLRKLRIDRGELLKDMADKLGMSSSMLSSIENNNRKPSSDFVSRVEGAYQLTAAQAEELARAAMGSLDTVAIDMRHLSAGDQELAFSFARRFSDLDAESKQNIMAILKGGNSQQ